MRFSIERYLHCPSHIAEARTPVCALKSRNRAEMTSSSNVIDYFAVLGKVAGPLACKKIPIGWNEPCNKLEFHPSDLWSAAITDISITFVDKGEALPDEGWEVLKDTIDGSPANLNSGDLERGLPHLAIRRRAQSKRLDHIVEIQLVRKGSEIPEGFEKVETSVTGAFFADINTAGVSSILIFKRSTGSIREYFVGSSFVDDVCVVLESNGEEVPEEYVVLENHNNSSSPVGNVVRIAYRKCVPLGLCDLKYESATLDRYPKEDLPDHELPTNELPLFAFPNDLKLRTAPFESYPLPDFFSMVFTGAKGDYLYCACLRFYEVIDNQTIKEMCKTVYGVDIDCEISELGLNFNIYCPKVICVVSTNPFYRAMRRYLRQLYSLSMSSIQCPLEFFIVPVVANLPVPIEGGRPFNLHLDAALINASSRAMAPVRFELPHDRFFPHMDLDFSGPLRCLSVEKLLAVFCLMLQEEKILFLCNSNALLTETMETLRSLVFPLTWSSCFVSRLPDSLSGILQALGGFMIGVSTVAHEGIKAETVGSPINIGDRKTVVEKRKEEVHSFMASSSITEAIHPGTYIVDLTGNELYQYTGNLETMIMSASRINSIVRSLPTGPKKRLTNKLQSIATDYDIGPQMSGLEIFDSAFEFQSLDDMGDVSSRKWADFPTLEIRDAFMVFMIDLLGDYSKYIVHPKQDLAEDVYRTFKEQFNITDYLADSDKNTRPLLEKLLETQMFAVLLQQRAEYAQYSIAFFESASDLVREMGLSAGGHGKQQMGSWTISKGVDLPVPVYKLLGQRRYASVVEIQHQDENREQSSRLRSAGPLEKAVARLQALESFKRPHIADEDEYQFTSTADNKESVENNEKRYELGRSNGEGLNLHDKEYGPLVIPGPTCVDSGRDSPVQFIYKDGWPTLSETNIKEAQNAIHANLKTLRDGRIYALEKVDRNIRMLTRSQSERISYRLSGRLLKEINISAKKERRVSFGLTIDIASLSIIMLCIRVMKKTRPVNDVLQIFGILAQYENINLVSLLDESVWRGILVACTSCGGNFMRGASCVIYELMKEINISPDALTYGQYIRAMAAVKCNVSLLDGADILDPFLHLEELGMMWFVHRSLHITKKNELNRDNSFSFSQNMSPNATKKGLGVMDFLRGRSPSNEANFSKEDYGKTSPFYLRQLLPQIYSKLEFVKYPGYFSLSAPSGTIVTTIIPRYMKNPLDNLLIKDHELYSLFENFDNVGAEIYNRYADQERPTSSKNFRPFRLSESSDGTFEEVFADFINDQYNQQAQDTSRRESVESTVSSKEENFTSPSRKPTSRWNPFVRRTFQEEQVEAIKNSTALLDMKQERLSLDGEEMRSMTDVLSKSLNEDNQKTIAEHRISSTTINSDLDTVDSSVAIGAKIARDNMLKLRDLVSKTLLEDKTAVGIHSQTACNCGYTLLDEEIISMWCGYSGGTKRSNPKLTDENEDEILDIASVHQIQCPQCRAYLTPKLHVRCYQKLDSPADGALKLKWSEDVPYFSPYGLRYSIEEILIQVGEKLVDSTWLYSSRSDIYWNLMWYFTRGKFPSGFVPLSRGTLQEGSESKSGPFDGTVFTGWREDVVKVQVQKFLECKGAHSNELTIKDLFPDSTQEDIDAIEKIREDLQARSLDSLKKALINISRMHSLLNSPICYGPILERSIYILLYTILQLYSQSESTVQEGPSLLSGILNIYSQVIDSVLTDEDYRLMGTERRITKSCALDSTALSILQTFGFLM